MLPLSLIPAFPESRMLLCCQKEKECCLTKKYVSHWLINEYLLSSCYMSWTLLGSTGNDTIDKIQMLLITWLNAGKYRKESSWPSSQHPVRGALSCCMQMVTWQEAKAFCQQLHEWHIKEGDLPASLKPSVCWWPWQLLDKNLRKARALSQSHPIMLSPQTWPTETVRTI